MSEQSQNSVISDTIIEFSEHTPTNKIEQHIVENEDPQEERIEDLDENIQSPKILTIKEKNLQIEEQIRKTKAQFQFVKKEKDYLCSELVRVNTVKSRLEGLCREFQKQNKQQVEESKRLGNEEQIKRFELSQKFEGTLQEITEKIQMEESDRLKQQQENALLREKLTKFMEQYELREQYSESQLKAKDLESQLLENKLKQQTEITYQEAQNSKKYKEQSELMEAKLKQQREIYLQESIKSHGYQDQIQTLMKTESELRSQLNLYSEKFEQFQQTLTKSNDVFNTFKQEMDRMTKTIAKYEKENGTLRKKCEQTDIQLIELAEERNNQKKQIESLKVQKQKLENLCRALQNERKKSSSTISTPLPPSSPSSFSPS